MRRACSSQHWLRNFLGRHTVGFSKNSIREKLAAHLYTQTVEIDYGQNVIRRNLKVVRTAGIGLDAASQAVAHKAALYYQPLQQNTLMMQGRKNVALVLGASRPNKVYPIERFVDLANALARATLTRTAC